MEEIEKKLKYSFELLGIKEDIKEFLKIEGFLDFCFENGFSNDVRNLSNLLLNLHKVGKSELEKIHYKLDKIRDIYYEISSKIYYEKLLSIYNSKPKATRIYYMENNCIIKNKQMPENYGERKRYYDGLFQIEKEKKNNIKYDRGCSEYTLKKKELEVDIDFEELNLPEIKRRKIQEKKNKDFKCTIKELVKAAEEIDNLIEQRLKEGEKSIKRENFKERLKKSKIKEFKDNSILNVQKLEVKEVTNILGMVGSGKTTIMVILAYLAAKKGYKIVIVLESTKEVFDLNNLLNVIGIKSTAIKGKSTILEQMDRVIENEEMYMESKYSKELAGTCILDGVIGKLDNLITLEYGEEPCYSLRKEGTKEKYLCPAYEVCTRKKSERDIENASIIVTNIHSLVYGKSHYSLKEGRRTLIEHIIDNWDIVIYDEADKAQVTLDKIFCKSESVNTLLKNNKSGIFQIIDRSIDEKDSDYSDIGISFFSIINYLTKVRSSVEENEVVRNIENLKSGKWFTGLILLQGFIKEFEDARAIKEIEEYILLGKKTDLINKYSQEILGEKVIKEEIKEKYNLSNEEMIKLEFVINITLLEKQIIRFSDTIQKIQMNQSIDFEIPDIFRAPFKNIKKLIPTSPIGNRLGYIYDNEEKDITIFRQFGMGRSLLLDLPNIKLNKEGKGIGPSVILLSGSSFAEGSLRYHVSRPVNYVLESESEIIEFIEKTEITRVPSKVRVSGSKDKIGAIEKLLDETKKYFDYEVDNGGKLLVIVNSYAQGKKAQEKLSVNYPNLNVYRLVPDSEKEEEKTIKRGRLKSLYKENINILVAPAISIERGHNIVDECGHSIFDSVFFVVRPMEIPKDIENIVSTINGAIVDVSIKWKNENILVSNEKIISEALKLWEISFRNYYSVSNTEEIIKRDIVVSRLVLIMQVFGRLLRIVDYNRPIPKIYFVDSAFTEGELNDFNLLKEIMGYLEEQISNSETGKLVELLYGPFYKALKGGNLNV